MKKEARSGSPKYNPNEFEGLSFYMYKESFVNDFFFELYYIKFVKTSGTIL